MEFHLARIAVVDFREWVQLHAGPVGESKNRNTEIESGDIRRCMSSGARARQVSCLFYYRVWPRYLLKGSLLSRLVCSGSHHRQGRRTTPRAQCSTRAVWPLHNFAPLPVRRCVAPCVLSRLSLSFTSIIPIGEIEQKKKRKIDVARVTSHCNICDVIGKLIRSLNLFILFGITSKTKISSLKAALE